MLGCDIIEIERIEDSYRKFGNNFLKKILSEEEIVLFEKKGKNMAFLAGRFAAKEAISKAFKTGMRDALTFTSISILNDSSGAPIAYLNGEEAGLEISISHCKEYAIAVCLLTK